MKPIIILPSAIRNKIQFIVDNCSMEVSGLGTIVFDPIANGYRVTDVMLLEQEVGSAHTDLDDNAVAKACFEMRNAEGELAFWWHSHVNMSTFWSTTDHDTMESIGKNGLCVAIVFNKKEEMRGAIVMTPQGFPSIKLDDVEIEVEYDYAFNPEELLEEIKLKVKPKTYIRETTPHHTTILGAPITEVNKSTNNIHATPAERQMALDQWSKMTKAERNFYTGFPEYLAEYIWGEDLNSGLYGNGY